MEKKSIKIPKQEYTIEFKELSVTRVKSGRSIGAVARVVTPEQMALSRLRAENTGLKRECEIIKRTS